MTQFTDNQPYNIEAPQKVYIQYSHDIFFDYSDGKYPDGTEDDWDWEDAYIPVTHDINGLEVGKTVFMRMKIGNASEWDVPLRLSDYITNIETFTVDTEDGENSFTFQLRYTFTDGTIIETDPVILYGGADGKEITSAVINPSGHLIITYSDGTVDDAGQAKGDDGVGVPQSGTDGHILVIRSNVSGWESIVNAFNENITTDGIIEHASAVFSHNLDNGNRHIPVGGSGGALLSTDGAGNYTWEVLDTTLKAPDEWDASVSTYPVLYKARAIEEGDTFYITVAGTMGTTVVNVGDLLVAQSDVPAQVDAEWFVVESNRDQATETILGVSKIATQAVTDTGTNDTDYITSLKLQTKLDAFGPYKIDSTSGNSFASFEPDGTNEYLSITTNSLNTAQFGGAGHTKLILDPGGIYGTTTGIAFGDGDTQIYQSLDDTLVFSRVGAAAFKLDSIGFSGNAGLSGSLRNVSVSSVIPTFIPYKSDVNTGIGWNGHDQLSLIAGGIEGIRIDEDTNPGFVRTWLNPDGAVGANTGLWFGDGNTGIYEGVDNQLRFNIAGTWEWVMDVGQLAALGGGALLNEIPSSTNPTVTPHNSRVNMGLGWAGGEQLSLIAGGVETQRITEGNGRTSTILNGIVVETITDASTTIATATLTKAGENFLTIVTVGDTVIVYGGTTAADYGTYIVESVDLDTQITVDRNFTVSNTDVDFDIISKGVTVENSIIDGVAGIHSSFIDFIPQEAPLAYKEGRFFYDATQRTITMYNDIVGSSLQVGHEQWFRAYNNSGGTIENGRFVYISGEIEIDIGNGLEWIPTVAYAIANDISCLGIIGSATHTVGDNEPILITTLGKVRDFDTSILPAGTVAYLSATIPGFYQATPPPSPNYLVKVGQVSHAHATEGTGEVGIQTSSNTQDVIKIFNGAMLEDHTVVVTSNGTVVTLTLDNADTVSDLSLFFNAQFHVFSAPASIALTIGSDTAPTRNFIYVPESTRVLTVSTVGWPSSGQYVAVADVVVQSAVGVQNDGPYKMHAWTDHLADSTNGGHLSHINKWIRNRPVSWDDGIDQTTTIVVNGGAIDNVYFATTSGSAFQLHDHSFPALDMQTGSPIWVINDSTTPYDRITDLSALDTDSTGATLRSNNTYYSIFIWGAINEDATDCKYFANAPSGFYASEATALADSSNYTNNSIPRIYRGVGFPIARVVLRYQTSSSGTLTEILTEDLLESLGGGGSATTGTEFSDNLFRVFNVADNTKELAFDISGITTGTTRTLVAPDNDGTIALIETTPTDEGIAFYDTTTLQLQTSSNLVFDGTNLEIGGGLIVNGNTLDMSTAGSNFIRATSTGGTLIFRTNGVSTNVFTIGTTGNTITTGTATAVNFIPTSDIRRKKEVSYGLGDVSIDGLKPSSFQIDDHFRYGFIAQDMLETHPELVENTGEEFVNVEGETEIDYYGVNESSIIALLVKEVQELKKIVNELKNK